MFKILHHFVCDDGILREIKWLNKEKDAPPEELYEWQWIPFGYDPIKLHFKLASGSVRKFEEGSLNFDHMSATFTYYNKSFRLNRSK